MSDLTGQDEARRALAEMIEACIDTQRKPSVSVAATPEFWRIAIEALRAPSLDRGAEEWSYDMKAAPKGRPHRVLVTVPSIHKGEEPIVGEAWYCTEERNEGWWWSGTSPGEWYDSPISETNAAPIAWRHLPAPAALPVPADLNEGGGK